MSTVRIQVRRGLASEWTSVNPILAAGEMGLESDTNFIKFGNGTDHWADLGYANDPTSFDLSNTLADYVLISDRNSAGGVAGLDSSKNVIVPGTSIIVEGSTDNDYETTLTVIDPTADRIISFPNNSGTVALTSDIGNAISSLIDAAPTALDTLNELAAALGDDPNYASTITTALGLKQDKVAGVSDTEIGYLDGVTSAIQTQLNGKASSNDISDMLTQTSAALTYLSKTDANSTYLSKTDAGSTYLTQTNAGSTYLTQTNASSTYLSKDTASSTYLTQTNAATTYAGKTDFETFRTDVTTNYATSSNVAATYAPLLNPTLTNPTVSGTLTLPTGSITSTHILNGTIATTDIADSAITSAKIADGTIVAGDIADGAITSAKILDGTIVDGDINESAAIAQSKINGLTTSLDSKLDSTTAATTYAPIASPTFTGTVAGITKSMVGLGNVDNTSDANKPVSTAAQTALDAKLSLTGGTMTGALTLSGAPTSDLHAATKGYVDGVSAGINFHQAVVAATAGNLAGVYDNGTNGLGATITASANGAIGTIDGASVSVGSRILLRAQTDTTQNGIYTVTNVGGSSAKWVVTRAADADNNPAGELATGDFCFVTGGNTYANTGFILSTSGTITVGTTGVTYTQFNAAQAINAGAGITKTGSTLSIESGAITSTMIADGTIVDADINASAAIAQSKVANLTSDLAAKAPLASPTFTGTVTVSSSGVAFTDGTQTKEGVPSRTPIVQKTGSYTLSSLTERDSLIEVASSTGVTITIPTDATLNYPVGTSIDILQTSTGQVTIAAATPATTTVNATPGLKLRTQWSSATLFKRAANTWVVMGDLTA